LGLEFGPNSVSSSRIPSLGVARFRVRNRWKRAYRFILWHFLLLASRTRAPRRRTTELRHRRTASSPPSDLLSRFRQQTGVLPRPSSRPGHAHPCPLPFSLPDQILASSTAELMDRSVVSPDPVCYDCFPFRID
jgi:hypothetical protein